MREIINCIIVDDEPLALDLIESYIKRVPYLNLIARFDNSIDAVAAIKDLNPDLLFFDIQMPDMTGIELAKYVPKNCSVIFITAFQQYAQIGRAHV